MLAFVGYNLINHLWWHGYHDSMRWNIGVLLKTKIPKDTRSSIATHSGQHSYHYYLFYRQCWRYNELQSKACEAPCMSCKILCSHIHFQHLRLWNEHNIHVSTDVLISKVLSNLLLTSIPKIIIVLIIITKHPK